MSNEFDCRYGEKEFKTVDAGIEAIEADLTGYDIHAKERLLYYLDWYMDPYYKKDLSSLYDPLKELLQKVVVYDNDTGVAEEALHLLEAYTEGPYVILAENVDVIAEEFKPTVLYLLNEDNDEMKGI